MKEVATSPHLPHPPLKTRIEALPERKRYEIVWPNVVRIDHEYRPTLRLDVDGETAQGVARNGGVRYLE
jgi:hypothetical protein